MQFLARCIFYMVFSISIIGCGGSSNEEGAVIPEEDQPTQEDLDADVPSPEETP